MVVITVLLLQAGVSFAQPQDVEGHWAQEQILEWLDKGWVECEDGMFNPDAKVTRGEFMALTNRAFGFYDSTQVNFSDLAEDHQYTEEVAKAVAAGYISGFGDGTVRPDEHISRLEATIILSRIAELPQLEDLTILAGFTDNEDIPVWGRGFVGAVVDIGLMSGCADGSFKPQEHITRAETITVLDNALDVLDVPTENITNMGYLDIEPSVVDGGMLKRVIVYYFLGEDFTEGTVTFHFPPGITATEYQDMVIISDSSGRTETFELEPLHIVNGGKDVHVTGITAAKDGVVMLLLKEKNISEPGYYDFSVTADADGAAEKLATEDELFETAELFSRIPPGYEGILEVSPRSAKSGSKQTFTLTYYLGDDFNEGWIEFDLPSEIAVIAGQDKIKIDGVEKLLAEADISDNGSKVHVNGITGPKGDTVTLTIYDKTIPEPGPYFYRVRADADGEDATKPATLGAGGEFMAFLAYSQVDGDNEIVKSFVKALNEGDSQAAIDLLADDVVYVDNYMDGYFDMYNSKEDIAEELDYMLGYKGTMESDENALKELAENVWQIEGRANDYFTTLTAELYPDDGFDGFGYTTKYFVTDNKICYIEFLWNGEDEVLFDKLNEGNIGILLLENDSGEVVIAACVPGMPAEKEGLKPGDIIVAIDDVNVEEMDDFGYEKAWYKILDKVGTKVKLTINRNGEVFDVEIERAAFL
jgi:hypothetical protein